MESEIIDARGQLCPKPLIMTKKALQEQGQGFAVLVDNTIAYENVKRFLTDNQVSYRTKAEGNDFVIEVSKSGEVCTAAPSSIVLEPLLTGNKIQNIICFKDDKMGAGPAELGAILLQSFCNTIKEISPLPVKIISYSNGVKLLAGDSPVLAAFKELEELGVEIVGCGACINYFDLEDKLAVGRITNMHDIIETLNNSSKVIYP